MSDRLLTADQVAQMIGMTRDYVYELSRKKQIPTITFGRTRRYRREAIEAWIKELEQNGGGLQTRPRNNPSTHN